MSISRSVFAFLPVLLIAAPVPMPDLKVEATDGGSVFHIRNNSTQPLTAYLIELVDYPGSNYALYHDVVNVQPLAPGEERRLPVANMTLGAAPEYVKMQAALYADGSSAGKPEKVTQLIGLRRTTLETTRELIARLKKGKSGDKDALIAELEGWAGSMPEPGRRDRGTPAALSRTTARQSILSTAARLRSASVDEVLATLVNSERVIGASKPAL